MIKIGIVDDHMIVRSGLKQFFFEQVDLRVAGASASSREATDLVRNVELDVLVMGFAHARPKRHCQGLVAERQNCQHLPDPCDRKSKPGV